MQQYTALFSAFPTLALPITFLKLQPEKNSYDYGRRWKMMRKMGAFLTTAEKAAKKMSGVGLITKKHTGHKGSDGSVVFFCDRTPDILHRNVWYIGRVV